METPEERKERVIRTVSGMIMSGWTDAKISSCTGMSKHELTHFRKLLNRPVQEPQHQLVGSFA